MKIVVIEIIDLIYYGKEYWYISIPLILIVLFFLSPYIPRFQSTYE